MIRHIDEKCLRTEASLVIFLLLPLCVALKGKDLSIKLKYIYSRPQGLLLLS